MYCFIYRSWWKEVLKMKLHKSIWKICIPAAVLGGGIVFTSGNVSADVISSSYAGNVPVATTVITMTEESENGTGWTETEEGRMYIQSDGTYAKGTVPIDHVIYLFDEMGIQQIGWQMIDGIRHYYDPVTGEAAVGVQEIEDVPYLFDFTGAQKTGWRTVNQIRVYYDPVTGELQTGWITCYDRNYFSNENGKLTGEIIVDGCRYLMNDDFGYQQVGMCTFSDDTVSYYDEEGNPVTGWVEINEDMYYFDSAYHMVTGIQVIDNATYYFLENGVRATGWQNIGNDTYYFESDGKMKFGFLLYQGNTYYFRSDGTMARSWQIINEKKYYFNGQGQMLKSWQTIGGKRYYFNAEGIAQIGFLTLQTGTYYMNDDGVMQTGWQDINGKKYYFQDNGVMLRSQRKDGYIIDANGVATKILYPKAVAILDKIGWDLKKAFDWSASLPYYGHTADMPQDKTPGIKWYADYGFDNLKGNCYVMAATFCEMARTLGYEAKQISGKVPLVSGGLGPHSWVEIIIDGITYVFDPNFTNDTGRNGYQISYGQSGTWRYVKEDVMTD